MLQSLPQELRLMIYERLFTSTTIRFKAPTIGPELPAPRSTNPLGLLRTCQTIYQDTTPIWHGMITLRFDNTACFLDILEPLSRSTLEQLRRVMVDRAHPICLLHLPKKRQFRHWPMHDGLIFLPGLQLDQLIIGDCLHHPELYDEPAWQEFGSDWEADRSSYNFIQSLLGRSNGWKEVRFVSPTASLLTWQSASDESNAINDWKLARWLQPRRWRKDLDERDGKESRPEVGLYRSGPDRSRLGSLPDLIEAAALGPEDSSTPWSGYEQRYGSPLGRGLDEPQGGIDVDTGSDPAALVIVRRGSHAEYVQPEGAQSTLQDFVRQSTGTDGTWRDAREAGLVWDPRQDMTACI